MKIKLNQDNTIRLRKETFKLTVKLSKLTTDRSKICYVTENESLSVVVFFLRKGKK